VALSAAPAEKGIGKRFGPGPENQIKETRSHSNCKKNLDGDKTLEGKVKEN